jgi:phosphoribosylglycinamide formyltransferase-1
MKLAVLISGTGSLMEAMIADNLPITLVLADRLCRGIEVAREKGVATELVERSFGKDFDRAEYTVRVMEVLARYNIDLVAMTGFMTIFDPVIFEKYKNNILNTHPSLLPACKGDNAPACALRTGAAGCTIHIATAELDAGPILAQERVPVLPTDTVATLHERIKVAERRLYPQVIRKYLEKIKS